MQLFSASSFPTIFFPAGSNVDQREDFWGEITWKFKTVEQGSEKKKIAGNCLGDDVWTASCSKCFGVGSECEEWGPDHSLPATPACRRGGV